MPHRVSNRLNSVLERWLPEQRLFLKSGDDTRFVRLRPMTQIAMVGGTALLIGWSIIASAILVIDQISAGSGRDQAARAQTAFEQRLTALAGERDARAAEAKAAQIRFTAALDQVSQMQSRLMAAQERQRELETGLGAVQTALQDTRGERDAAKTELAALSGTAKGGATSLTARAHELSVALDIVADELKTAATARSAAEKRAAEATRTAEALAVERDQIVARNDAVLAQLEDQVNVSLKPMDDMFRKVGLDSDKILQTIDKGYSGQGGPLTPIGKSTSGNAAISQSEARAGEIMISLDKVNRYRIAASKMPLAMPVKSAFRYTSPFGRRWGRMHEGIDLAGPVGTPIYATGDGVVIFAGWKSGYGNVIQIQHALGTETRYGHLSKIGVSVGQKVSRNSLIGAMGNTGRSTGPHLHYEVRVNGQAVNPMSFIKAAENVF